MTTAPETPLDKWGQAVVVDGESFQLRRVEGAIAYLAPADCPEIADELLLPMELEAIAA